jgi:hypothetical protein
MTYKLVVYVPLTHAEKLRQALGDAGSGIIGNYSYCSFSAVGLGHFKPLEGSNPFIGKLGELEEVQEARIEVNVPREKIHDMLAVMKAAHPYEEVAYDVFERVAI